jgi:hypothetical protein
MEHSPQETAYVRVDKFSNTGGSLLLISWKGRTTIFPCAQPSQRGDDSAALLMLRPLIMLLFAIL